MRSRIRQSIAAALVALAPALAGAQTSAIPGLFNTGVDASGNKLPVGVADPHYTVLENGGAAAMTYDNGAYAQRATSQYIWQTSSGTPGSTTRTFRTTFMLGAGLDPLTALITGEWSTDNVGLNILINGVATGNTSPTFSFFTPFTINTGFVSGLNTLDFVVQDQGPPGALNVNNIQGTVRALQGPSTTVPEPTTVVLMGSGLAALGFFGARRKRAA